MKWDMKLSVMTVLLVKELIGEEIKGVSECIMLHCYVSLMFPRVKMGLSELLTVVTTSSQFDILFLNIISFSSFSFWTLTASTFSGHLCLLNPGQ